ncbi:MAG: hypothetical protein AAB853_02385 [Patescibacteria group bacterium]
MASAAPTDDESFALQECQHLLSGDCRQLLGMCRKIDVLHPNEAELHIRMLLFLKTKQSDLLEALVKFRERLGPVFGIRGEPGNFRGTIRPHPAE